MRVIAGLAKGKRLKAPPGNDTRPITDRIKEALFNVLGTNIADSYFLDLFAGSGSVGIEALSRNAKEAVFIDSFPLAVKAMKENIINCKFEEKAEVYCQDVFKAIEILKKNDKYFDFIYIDPPFTKEDFFDKVMEKLDNHKIYKENVVIVIRIPRKKDLNKDLTNLEHYRENIYGESCLHYYRFKGDLN